MIFSQKYDYKFCYIYHKIVQIDFSFTKFRGIIGLKLVLE